MNSFDRMMRWQARHESRRAPTRKEHYGQVAEAVGRAPGPRGRGRLLQRRGRGVNCPDPPFRHLIRITDHIGLLEYAEGIVPRHEGGYCVDDAAGGLMILCREP